MDKRYKFQGAIDSMNTREAKRREKLSMRRSVKYNVFDPRCNSPIGIWKLKEAGLGHKTEEQECVETQKEAKGKRGSSI